MEKDTRKPRAKVAAEAAAAAVTAVVAAGMEVEVEAAGLEGVGTQDSEEKEILPSSLHSTPEILMPPTPQKQKNPPLPVALNGVV